jgi:hypothetical protein
MDLQELSRQLNIHVERLTYVSTHHNEEVCLNPNEFLVDLTRIPYEQILKPDKQYEHCSIIRDSIQDHIYIQDHIHSRPYTFKTKHGVLNVKSQNLLKYASNIQLG